MAGCVLISALLCSYILFQISKSRTFQFFGGLTYRVATDHKVVALTFDDAPTLKTADVLAILKQKHVVATFYEIGKEIERYPEIAKAVVAAGMEVGNHSYSHQRFLLTSPSFVQSEVQKTNDLIRSTGYKGDITFRPPNGKKLFSLPWYLHQHGIQTIMWDVEPDTYLPTNQTEDEQTTFLVGYTVANVRPGSIILLHPFCDTCGGDRRAIGQIIDDLQSKGYKFVTISQLLASSTQH